MLRVPWAPLNGGVFLIIFGTLMLLSLVQVGGLNLYTGIPLIFLVFGVWLVIAAFAVPRPDDRYAPPRSMILAWGGLVAFLGAIWYVGTLNPLLVPVVILVVMVVVGIGAVGYALTRAEAKKAHPAVA
jgi:predicted MFS family arabinose efflux permease